MPTTPTTLTAGDLAVVNFNAANDSFTVVALADIGVGTTIHFTDRGWSSTIGGFTQNVGRDGTISWTTGEAIKAGTVIDIALVFDASMNASAQVSNGGRPVAGSAVIDGWINGNAGSTDGIGTSDQVLIYQGSATAPTMIFAYNNGAASTGTWSSSPVAGSSNTLSEVPPGLVPGVTAIGVPNGSRPHSGYTADIGEGTKESWLAKLGNSSNWTLATAATGAVTDTLGDSVTVWVPPRVDTVTAAPVGQGARDATDYTFTIKYADSDNALNIGSIGLDDISVTHTDGRTLEVIAASLDPVTSTATYTVRTPSNGWKDTDNGVYTIAVKQGEVVDETGLGIAATPNAGSFTVSVDTTAPGKPTIEAISNDNGRSSTDFTTNNGAQTLTGRAEAGATVTIFLNGQQVDTAVANQSGFWSSTPGAFTLGHSEFTFTASARDAAGNVSELSAPVKVTVDLMQPDTMIVTGPPLVTNSKNPVFTFASNEADVRYEVSLDGAAYTSPVGLFNLADGSHTYRVRAVDAAGNVDSTPAMYGWTIDTQAPVVQSMQANTTAPAAGGSVIYRVVFSEDVINVDAGDFLLASTGSASGNISGVQSINPRTYDVTVDGFQGAGTVTLQLNPASSIADAAGNAPSGPASGDVISFDHTDPAEPPVLTPSGGNSHFTEGNNVPSSPVVVDAGLTVSDADSGTLASATVGIVGNFFNGDLLGFVNDGATMGNIVGSYNAVTGTLTLTSAGATATLAQWQAALREVTFVTVSETPSSAARVISFSVSDGVAVSTPVSKTVEVTPVDDDPVLSLPSTLNATEDVPTVLTGITISDVDSPAAAVTVMLQVPAGTLSASSGSPVTVLGSGTGLLILTGPLADINAYIAGAGVLYTSAPNATADVELQVSIHGGATPVAGTATIKLAAVNDAPVNTVPGDQSVREGSALTFSTANGNAIHIDDVDAGSSEVIVTLTAANGSIFLSGTAGLTFLQGSGNGDTLAQFSGTLANINAALEGMRFVPAAGAGDHATLSIETNDQGSSGSGGAKADIDTVAIEIQPKVPAISAVAATSADGVYKIGDTVTIAVTFDSEIALDTNHGSPTLLLETGASDRLAVFKDMPDGFTLIFEYVVQEGDSSADLDYLSGSALQLNGAFVVSVADGANASIALPAPGTTGSLAGHSAIVIDGQRADPVPQPQPQPEDQDGIPAAIENAVPGMPRADGGPAVQGDGNGDGLRDSAQADVASLPLLLSDAASQNPDAPPVYVTLVGGSAAGIPVVNDAVTLLDVKQFDAPQGKPGSLDMPLGLLGFTAQVGTAGATATFSLFVDDDVAVNGYWKQDATGAWVNLASAAYGGRIVTEHGKTRLDFQLTDGGEFDADGVANGSIVDPGAPGAWPDAVTDSDGDQAPDALEAGLGLSVGARDNDVFGDSKLFVMQLYRDALGREADAEGLAYWQQQLDGGAMQRVELLRAFVDGQEFQQGSEALVRLYSGAFDRAVDDPGLAYWASQLEAGTGIAAIAASFSERIAAGSSDGDFLAQLYCTVLGRSADDGGLAFWQSELDGGMTRGEVLARFTQSDEFDAAQSDRIDLTLAYLTVLDRVPDQAGFDYWLGRLSDGESVEQVVAGMMGSQEYMERFVDVEVVGVSVEQDLLV
ncbi:DUF4214 domain-containing protein [Paracidovorax citrulli]